MGFLKIYGASDDLVEIEGDMEDEIPCYEQDVEILVNDGTRLRAHYGTGGMWRLSVVQTGTETTVTHTPASDPDTNYTDMVTLENSSVEKLQAEATLH